MKTRMQGWLARVALSLVAIAAWGTGATAQSLSGVYGGEKCPYKLTFRGKDVVYMQVIGIAEVPGQYKVDGDKVPVTAGVYSTVFTRNGEALVTLFAGETVVCTKVSDPISFVPVQGVWTLNYRRVVTQVTQEGTPLVFDTRSAPPCSASVRRACANLPFYLVLDTTNQGQYSFARVPPSDPSYTPLARGSAAVARDSLILGGAHPATYSLQISSSRMHLTRHFKLGADGAWSFGWSLGPGDSLEATGEWWYQRGLSRSDVAMPIEPAPLPPKPKKSSKRSPV